MIGDLLQPTHLIFVLVIALLILGPKRLPEAGRALGRSVNGFRSGLSGIEDEVSDVFHHGAKADPTEALDPSLEPVVVSSATQDPTAI